MTQPKREFCKKGHKLTPDNLYVHLKTGNRRCLICKRAIEAKWNAKRKEERLMKRYHDDLDAEHEVSDG